MLVIIQFKSDKDNWPRDDAARELEELAKTSGAEVVEVMFCGRDHPTADLLIGKGKVEEIGLVCQDAEIDTVIFNYDLSGTQQRNLEDALNKKTIDRTQLILDIFSRNAHSPEGKAQVELAQLQYLLPRLTGKGIALSRLGGGIGTRGPGETKLEVDRRRINKRIDKLKKDLKGLTNHRRVMRKKRNDEGVPCVTLVGYTNAGKSTLLNALTGAKQVAANSLFTTLDPLSRRLELSSGVETIISDTVGFLQNLPHHLIDAFHATLEEVEEADLLISVLDASHSRVQEHREAVLAVLEELQSQDKPTILVLNKIDLVQDHAWRNWLNEKFFDSVCISAKTGENLEELTKQIEDFFAPGMVKVTLSVPLNQMSIVDLLHRKARVKNAEYGNKAVKIEVQLPKSLLSNILKNKGVEVIS